LKYILETHPKAIHIATQKKLGNKEYVFANASPHLKKRWVTKPNRNKGFRDNLKFQYFKLSPPKNKFGVKI